MKEGYTIYAKDGQIMETKNNLESMSAGQVSVLLEKAAKFCKEGSGNITIVGDNTTRRGKITVKVTCERKSNDTVSWEYEGIETNITDDQLLVSLLEKARIPFVAIGWK